MVSRKNEKALKNIPTVLVIFGVTGDLTAKKIAPALFSLFRQGDLPEMFHLVGFSRRSLTAPEFRQYITGVLAKQKDFDADECAKFCGAISYQRGTFENAGDYRALREELKRVDDRWGVCSNKLFYLAVPPEYYEGIFKELKTSGLTKTCSNEEGWTRVLVEKPFGENLATAQRLDELLGEFFQESQIYRIDHYLGKEMAQSILTFRFANNLAEKSWSNECVESINIRLWENLGVEHRGSFYDGVGALRDVGQNHLLQLLALVTMEHPGSLASDAIRARRAEVLQMLIPPDAREVRTAALRAQYSGYQGITGVRKSSETETYFKVRAFLDSPRWRGVPITLESGKRLGEVKKEVEIIFKHPDPCFCPPHDAAQYKNRVVIALEPKEGFSVEFWSKKPGLKFDMQREVFDALRENPNRRQYVEEYKKLLWDAFAGDQTLFASTAEVRAMWRFVDPIINAWKANAVPLASYKPDTAEALLAAAKVNWYAPCHNSGSATARKSRRNLARNKRSLKHR
ncbi:MAG: glucose-6-phosphate dehydrogenase [bacterium]|nr:glucose-6-phosphate dehydrogenase [bacterium]